MESLFFIIIYIRRIFHQGFIIFFLEYTTYNMRSDSMMAWQYKLHSQKMTIKNEIRHDKIIFRRIENTRSMK